MCLIPTNLPSSSAEDSSYDQGIGGAEGAAHKKQVTATTWTQETERRFARGWLNRPDHLVTFCNDKVCRRGRPPCISSSPLGLDHLPNFPSFDAWRVARR